MEEMLKSNEYIEVEKCSYGCRIYIGGEYAVSLTPDECKKLSDALKEV